MSNSQVKKVIKMHCNLHLTNNIEEISYSDDHIDWSSNENSK